MDVWRMLDSLIKRVVVIMFSSKKQHGYEKIESMTDDDGDT